MNTQHFRAAGPHHRLATDLPPYEWRAGLIQFLLSWTGWKESTVSSKRKEMRVLLWLLTGKWWHAGVKSTASFRGSRVCLDLPGLLLQSEYSCHLQQSFSGFHKESLITPHINTFLSPPPRGNFCPLQPNETELQRAKGEAMSLPVWRRTKDKWTMEHLVLVVVVLVVLICFC